MPSSSRPPKLLGLFLHNLNDGLLHLDLLHGKLGTASLSRFSHPIEGAAQFDIGDLVPDISIGFWLPKDLPVMIVLLILVSSVAVDIDPAIISQVPPAPLALTADPPLEVADCESSRLANPHKSTPSVKVGETVLSE